MKKKINKNAELTSTQIVLLLVLVLGFAICLYFIINYFWTPEIDKQACHESAVLKATIPDINGEKAIPLPLNCETEKICITQNLILNGDCSEEFANEKYSTVRITSNKDKQDNEINAIIAEKVKDCWWMMGEGKLQIHSRYLDFKIGKVCNICTRIAFSEELKKEKKSVNGFVNYLMTHEIEKDKTYWNYITDTTGAHISGYDYEKDKLDLTQTAIVFQEISKGALNEWFPFVGGASGILSGAATGAYIGSVVPIVGTAIGGVIGGGIGFALGYYTGEAADTGVEKILAELSGTDKTVYGSIQVIPYNLDLLKQLKCNDFEGKA
ncbi:MAG: hypothetical protein ACP5OG_04805 [Candidatus Nanoarchaeia archaeon]